ncbi:MAG: hypothetical protein CL944_00395 [Candidatus Diapherotrites archaeon]|uniref:Uncharacterized protein n=1 Tax=Candidatus Iainarchaeum sp. TaxID=3101447 RepID=A0A2D6LP88_9ARCH|nr:hypothetical protein [Candidatus Diapherotrites archaeon]|tara:strand:- start:12879 stop:13247 length:369 start_codon:yes stop_codon:yes gene_type:complete
MVFFEALQALLSLDVSFFVNIIIDHIIFVFGIAAAAHYFFDGKKLIFWFVFISVTLWALIDLGTYTGLVFTGTLFLLVYYITKFAVLAFVESVPSLKPYIVAFNEFHFFIMLIIFLFFVGGG